MITLIVYIDKKTEKKGYCLRYYKNVMSFNKNYISKIIGLSVDILDNLDIGIYQLCISTVDYIKKF